MRQERNYTNKFKLEAVQLSINSTRSVNDIAKLLGISNSSLYRWRKQYVSSKRIEEHTEARLARLLREIDLINQLILVSVSGRDKIKILHIGCEMLADHFSMSRSMIALLKDDVDINVVAEHKPFNTEPLKDSIIRAKGLVKDAVKAGTPIYVVDNELNDSKESIHSLWSNQKAKSVIVIPISVNEQTIGLFWGEFDSNVYEFASIEIEFVDMIVKELGLTLEFVLLNERLHKHNAEMEHGVAERTHELAKENLQLKELNQLKSKFLSNVTHELRTPLTSVMMYLELLKRAKTEPDKWDQYISVIGKDINRLMALVEDVLNLSRMEQDEVSREISTINLNDLVEEIFNDFKTRAESSNIKLFFNSPGEKYFVRGTRFQLQQGINNLVSNAINYTPDGTINLDIYLSNDEKQVCIEVQDTGIGIDPSEISHLFDRFFRGSQALKSSIPGTGLGLAIVKEIADQHEGRIEVESALEKGSIFRFWLSLYKVERPQTGGVIAASTSNLRKATILIVEDEYNLLRGLVEIVSMVDFGYDVRVLEATNGKDALQVMATETPDLIISDIMMPAMDGYEFLRQVRNNDQWVHIPFIFLTARGEKRDIHKGLQEGVEAYVTKPYDSDELVIIVKNKLDRTRQILETRIFDKSTIIRKNWELAVDAIRNGQGNSYWASVSSICKSLSESCNLDLKLDKRPKAPLSHPISFQINIESISIGTNLPSFLPIIISATGKFSTDYLKLLGDLIDQHTQFAHRYAILLCFDEEANLSELRQFLKQRLHAFAYDIVLLSLEDLLDITSSNHPPSALRRKILQQVSLKLISLFVTTGPTPDYMFFGRESEMRQILRGISNNSFVILGGRRIGKTSMLSLLHKVRLPEAGYYSAFHDCSSTPDVSALLSSRIRNWLPKPPTNDPITFRDFFQSPLTAQRIVLLFDEADKLIPFDTANSWFFFRSLRALVTSSNVQVILSGERTLRDAMHDPYSPLFNFANEVLLQPLDYHAVEELVSQPMRQLEIELSDEKAIVRRIFEFTSGHPNVVQRLCSNLIEILNDQGIRTVTVEDVNTIIDNPGFLRNDFLSTYWGTATPLEKVISLIMADDLNVRTLQSVRQALANRCELTPKIQEIDNALQLLVDLRSILRRTSSGYEFAVPAFPNIVARTMSLEDMLEIHSEQYQEFSR